MSGSAVSMFASGVLLLASVVGVSAQDLPRAVANDQRATAGVVDEGELRIQLEAVEAAWYPRGEAGPRVVTPAFAEVGASPSVPGPLLRMSAGTPVEVTVHNRLTHPIEVRGLGDRRPEVGRNGLPAFLFDDPVEIPPGESRTVSFTPEHDASSFYYGRRVLPPDAPSGQFPRWLPGGIADEGAFMGAYIVDPAGAAPPPGERVMMMTRWGSEDEPGSLNPSWKMFINGESWPHTDRIEGTVGDTLRWRVINASLVSHPMHLHGFYFDVDATGDAQADTVFADGDRRHVVTEHMSDLSSMRLTWVPERPGNWLFHCHLVRHMGELQRFEVERGDGVDPAGHDATMAGLVMGIQIRPRPGDQAIDPPAARRIDLWTGTRPAVYGEAPELGFVVQQGDVPPPDSTSVPGSTLVLTRGEPTEIVIHNRLDIPLSVHWHGLELRSLYDGVGGWSGPVDRPLAPIEPGASRSVVIEPVRAGTFFYHTHGEPGHELTQGLYGPFLVVEPDDPWSPEADRVFMLAARGAEIDATPAINGRIQPEPEQFEPGRAYRLRFAQISADSYKRVRLLRGDEVVTWQLWAKDGADLPASSRGPAPAEFGIGVGEAVDVRWTPETPGVYVLEVTTEFYPSRGGREVQRIAFSVGDAVTETDLRVALTGSALETVELPAEARARYVGTYAGTLGDAEAILAVWEGDDGLLHGFESPADGATDTRHFIFLGDHLFTPGSVADGVVDIPDPDRRARFVVDGDRASAVEFLAGEAVVDRLSRVADYDLPPEALQGLTGTFASEDFPLDVVVEVEGGALLLLFGPNPPVAMHAISPSRFLPGPGAAVPPDLLVTFLRRESGLTLRIDVQGDRFELQRTGGGG